MKCQRFIAMYFPEPLDFILFRPFISVLCIVPGGPLKRCVQEKNYMRIKATLITLKS